MIYQDIMDAPPQYQWDEDSAPCQSANCRCTCEAMIASFYLDKHIAPKEIRRLMKGNYACGPTNNRDGVRALKALDIPASTGWLTSSGVKAKLNANIPVDLAVLYSKIPDLPQYKSDYGFEGWHSVLAIKAVTEGGRAGIWVRDPDWHYKKPAKSYVFWPDTIWITAFVQSKYGGIAVWPLNQKKRMSVSSSMVVTTQLVILRDKPSTHTGKLIKLFDAGVRFAYTRTVKGDEYKFEDGLRSDWREVLYSGQKCYLPAGFTWIDEV
jgi:hypothetical protein